MHMRQMRGIERVDEAIEEGARIRVCYRLCAEPGVVEALARRIAYEQTVELPEALVTAPEVLEHVVGRVEGIEPEGEDRHRVTISYAAELANGQLPQLLNLVFGNASIFPDVRVLDLELPPGLLGRFDGPRYGVEGLRALTGVHGRPLLATALKPRGTPRERLAAMAGAFAEGGGDIVKDDQNLVDEFEPFKARVEACRQAVEAANEASGRRCLYFPHVAASHGELARYFEFVARAGLRGVLVCPLIMGLESARALAAEHDLVMMAHPALAGSFLQGERQGIAHEVLLGTLFRLAGADISIFPHAGGRFAFTRAQCLAIRDRLRAPLGGLEPAWPAPAGGMHYENLGELGEDYGADAVFLIGGSLLGHSEDLAAGTRAFLDRIRERFDERLTAPGDPHPVVHPSPPEARHFAFREGFEWAGRPSSPYKDAGDLAFKGVRRVELVGKHGERTNADLRYFEVEPGGYSSREKHLHTHIIIAARGRGVLELGGRRLELGPMDVAYVEPLEVHQLRNEGAEPFGFFCVVDHSRDRPMRG